MTIGEVEDHPFLDFDRTIFPHLKSLETPSLSQLYEKVEKARYIRWGLYGAAMVLSAIAVPSLFLFKPIVARSLGVLAVVSLAASFFFHKPLPYLILSIDGGGIRGMIPIQLLALIEKEVGCKIGELFDCIAGTSIGGILALSLTQPDPNNPSKPKRGAVETAQFLEKEGPHVFERTTFQMFKSVEGIWSPKYSNKNLKTILEKELGDTLLEEAVTDVLLPSYDLIKGKPAIFFHFKGKEKTQQTSFLMRDAAMGSAAAPMYFPSYPVQDNGHVLNLVDGGVIANNPSLLAYMKAAGQIDPNRDIFILSVGTGRFPLKEISPAESEKYGIMQWMPLIFDLIFQSTQEVLTLQFKLLKYIGEIPLSLIRLQPQLDNLAQEQLDNGTVENIQALKAVAKRYFEENYPLIRQEIIEPLKKYRAGFSNPTTEKIQQVVAAPAA